jgi:hypothetical protein
MQGHSADMVGNVAITGNLVRIETMFFSGAEFDKKQLKSEPPHRFVMPLRAFCVYWR